MFRDSTRKEGVEDPDLSHQYDGMIKQLVQTIRKIPATDPSKTGVSDTGKSGTELKTATAQDVVSIRQVMLGIKQALEEFYSTPEEHFPKLEEWAMLTILTGDAVATEQTHGVSRVQYRRVEQRVQYRTVEQRVQNNKVEYTTEQ